jgi:hypothetical protein
MQCLDTSKTYESAKGRRALTKISQNSNLRIKYSLKPPVQLSPYLASGRAFCEATSIGQSQL